MTRRSTPSTIALVAIATAAVAGCGEHSRERPAAPSMPTSTVAGPEIVEIAERCVPPSPLAARHHDVEPSVARVRLDGSVRAATRADRRFITRLVLRAGSGGRFAGRLVGTRRAGGASRATLRWSGAAGILLPDAELAIGADRIRIRTGSGSPWRDAGSASGAALDVGRELLDHPFLLRPVRAARRGNRLDVDLVAPPARLRAYATAERRGPVTELLRGARSLRITAHVRGDELVGDRFRLVTTVPSGIPTLTPLAGRLVEVVGSTGSCPLTR